LIVIACLLGSIEIFFRFHQGDNPAEMGRGLRQDFRPYVMFTVKPGSPDVQE
jgi:hypothetical protein